MSDDDSIATGAAYELGTTSLGLDLLFEKFVSDDISVRSIAAYGIVHAGKSAVPRLLELIDQAEPGLQLRIIDVIGDIGTEAEDAVGRLVSLSKSEDVQVRRAVAEALGLIAQAYKKISNELIQAFDQSACRRRCYCRKECYIFYFTAWRRRQHPNHCRAYRPNLSHWHHHVRGWSIETLQRLDSSYSYETCLELLDGGSLGSGSQIRRHRANCQSDGKSQLVIFNRDASGCRQQIRLSKNGILSL